MAREAGGPGKVTQALSLACPGQGMSTLGQAAHSKASNLPKLGTWLTQHQGPGERKGLHSGMVEFQPDIQGSENDPRCCGERTVSRA